MPLVGIEVAQEREVLAAALVSGDVRDELLDHASPLGIGDPVGVTQCNVRGAHDPVAIVEVVVVHVRNAAELLRIADQRSGLRVVREVRRMLAVEPRLQP